MNKIIKPILDGVACVNTGVVISLEGIESVLSIICMVLTILSIIGGVVIDVIFKIKQAKNDNVITKEEVNDIIDTVKNGVDDIKDEINKK